MMNYIVPAGVEKSCQNFGAGWGSHEKTSWKRSCKNPASGWVGSIHTTQVARPMRLWMDTAERHNCVNLSGIYFYFSSLNSLVWWWHFISNASDNRFPYIRSPETCYFVQLSNEKICLSRSGKIPQMFMPPFPTPKGKRNCHSACYFINYFFLRQDSEEIMDKKKNTFIVE